MRVLRVFGWLLYDVVLPAFGLVVCVLALGAFISAIIHVHDNVVHAANIVLDTRYWACTQVQKSVVRTPTLMGKILIPVDVEVSECVTYTKKQ